MQYSKSTVLKAFICTAKVFWNIIIFKKQNTFVWDEVKNKIQTKILI